MNSKANTDRSYSTSSFSFSLYLILYIYVFIYFFKVYILHSHQGIAPQRTDVIVPAAVRRFPEVDGSADTNSVQIPKKNRQEVMEVEHSDIE